MSGGALDSAGPLIARLRRYFTGPMFFGDGGGADKKSDATAARMRVADGENVFARQARRFTVSQTIVWCFYAFAAYYAVTQCTDFPGLSRRLNFSPLWPVAWMGNLAGKTRVPEIVGLEVFYVLASVAGAFFARWRGARVLVFAGLLEYFAFRNSFGKIGHSTHLFMTVAFLLIFLPADWHRPAALVSRRARQETLLVFWLCQAAMLLSYSMSGLSKVGAAFYQIAAGQTSAFSPGAIGAHVAQRLVQTHSQSIMGDVLIGHPWLTWPLMPFPIYLELFAFWIAFRPALQRWWALALILFHIGTVFTMTITFPVSCLLLALFFFQSPFQSSTVRWREIVAGLPLVCELLVLPSFLRHRGELRKAKKFSVMTSSPLCPLPEGREAPRF